MPQINGVEYVGDAAVYDKKRQGVAHEEFKAKVNFSDKTLTIFGLSGKINGNKFTFENKKTKGKGKGQFYGKQAAELGGTYEADDMSAAFGAKKK